jgi:hypothetical protein
MDLAGQLAVVTPILALCVGGGLVRRKHQTVGIALVASAVAAVVLLAIFGSWRPIVGMISIVGFLVGLEVDRPGKPRRRALGLLGITVGMFALLIAVAYT